MPQRDCPQSFVPSSPGFRVSYSLRCKQLVFFPTRLWNVFVSVYFKVTVVDVRISPLWKGRLNRGLRTRIDCWNLPFGIGLLPMSMNSDRSVRLLDCAWVSDVKCDRGANRAEPETVTPVCIHFPVLMEISTRCALLQSFHVQESHRVALYRKQIVCHLATLTWGMRSMYHRRRATSAGLQRVYNCWRDGQRNANWDDASF